MDFIGSRRRRSPKKVGIPNMFSREDLDAGVKVGLELGRIGYAWKADRITGFNRVCLTQVPNQ